MKKISLLIFAFSVIIPASLFSAEPFVPTEDDAVAIVESTAAEIEEDTPAAVNGICRGDEAYWSRENRDFFVFVLNEDIRVMACPLRMYLGRVYKGIKDAEGKEFRDEAVKNALKNKEGGWVEFSSLGANGVIRKKTYYKLVKGSDSRNYIVCCDIDVKE